MNIQFIPVCEENFPFISKLCVSIAQRKMVETVAECFDEAKEVKLWRPVGIKCDKDFVGFAMYGLWENEGEHGRAWLDRFFIDEHYQGKGYSKKILPLLLSKIALEYSCDKIFLSVYSDNSVAIRLYQGLGFAFTGETDINGERVMTKVLPLFLQKTTEE